MLSQRWFGQWLRGVPPCWEPEVICSVSGWVNTGLMGAPPLRRPLGDTEVTHPGQVAASGPQGTNQIHCWLRNRRFIFPR